MQKKIKNKVQIIESLGALVQLDYDATLAYEQAVQSVGIPRVRARLAAFKRDHERHIVDLSAVIHRLGGKPPECARDFKGFVIQGFTRLRSMTGTAGALRAMRGNELLTNLYYDLALALELPANVQNLVTRNRDDEVRHLAYIELMIREKIWEEEERREAA